MTDTKPSKKEKSPFLKSFHFAFRGIFTALKKERNLKIYFTAAILVIILGFLKNFSQIQWMVIILLIGVVISAEICNSAVEGICDLLREKLNLKYEETTFIRDASAGAVLVLAIAAFLIGLLVFVF